MDVFDRLDAVAERLRNGDAEAAGGLSTGERLYAYLAANKIPPGDTIAYALARMGPEWVEALISRHRYD